MIVIVQGTRGNYLSYLISCAFTQQVYKVIKELTCLVEGWIEASTEKNIRSLVKNPILKGYK